MASMRTTKYEFRTNTMKKFYVLSEGEPSSHNNLWEVISRSLSPVPCILSEGQFEIATAVTSYSLTNDNNIFNV